MSPSEFSTNTVKKALLLSGVVLLAVALLNTELELRRDWASATEQRLEDVRFPSPEVIRLLTLNYPTLGADLLWVTLVVQHAQFVRMRDAAGENLLDNGFVLAQTDPGFYRLYNWITGAYLNHRHPISEQDLAGLADLHELGMERFPEDADIRVSAALLFIGHGRFSREVRAEQSRRAVRYLEEAVPLDRENSQILPSLRFFRNRARLPTGDQGYVDEAAFWLQILRTSEETAMRERAKRRLEQLDATSPGLAKQQELLDQHLAERPFVPFALWAVTLQKPSDQ